MINWGRMCVVFPVLAFVMCVVAMIYNLIDGNLMYAAFMATAAVVNVWAFDAIWNNTRY